MVVVWHTLEGQRVKFQNLVAAGDDRPRQDSQKRVEVVDGVVVQLHANKEGGPRMKRVG